MFEVIRGKCNKPVVSKKLEEILVHNNINGTLYFGYPIIGTDDEVISIDATFISPEYGIIIFDLIEDGKEKDRKEYQDLIFNNLEAKLKQKKKLVIGRKLVVEINVITFAPGWINNAKNEFVVKNEKEMINKIIRIKWNEKKYYKELVATIQAISKIKNYSKRENITNERSKGSKIKLVENSIANLDRFQTSAIIETANGPQRIRGLAGSGKTVVLALKVAYLHAQFPNWKIAVTFNTRSLKNQFYDLIERFTYEHINSKPDWNNVKIIHAWGSPSINGIYYEICKYHNIEYQDYDFAKRKYGIGKEFQGVCKKAIDEIKKYKEMYDVILIDEAQDFTEEFLQLCYSILKPPKKLIWAYDELQNLNNTRMRSPEDIFGKNEDGSFKVVLKNELYKPKEDIILEKCYRNSKSILTLAHALGFGIYRTENLVQMFDDTILWKEIGYEVITGELEYGKKISLKRTNETSPEFLEEHSTIDDIIVTKSFDNKNDQAFWIANEIEKNIGEDELEPSDIVVIHSNPVKTIDEVGIIRDLLYKKGINSHLVGVTTSQDGFFEKDSITFTSIFRAKGNEAPMVYVMDAHECFTGTELIKKRNILFTALTRSKAWVRICGYGSNMILLEKEINKTKENNFTLSFKYPTKEEMEQLNIIHRDRTQNEKIEIKKQLHNIEELVVSLKNGKINISDLDKDLLNELKEIIGHDKRSI